MHESPRLKALLKCLLLVFNLTFCCADLLVVSQFTKLSQVLWISVFTFSLSIPNLSPLPTLLSVIWKKIKSLLIKLISSRTVLAGIFLETQLFSVVSILTWMVQSYQTTVSMFWKCFFSLLGRTVCARRACWNLLHCFLFIRVAL